MSEIKNGDENALESQGTDAPNAPVEEVAAADDSDLQAQLDKANELANNYKLRAEKAEKASKAEPAKAKATAKTKSDDLDYGQKAFLATQGIKGSAEFDFVQNELKSSGKGLEDLLDNAYFKSELDNFRSLNATADATPSGKRSGSPALDSVDYWMAKPIAEVPQDMRIKVVNAKLEKEKSTGVFYNSKK